MTLGCDSWAVMTVSSGSPSRRLSLALFSMICAADGECLGAYSTSSNKKNSAVTFKPKVS